jgi:hypothetical protein
MFGNSREPRKAYPWWNECEEQTHLSPKNRYPDKTVPQAGLAKMPKRKLGAMKSAAPHNSGKGIKHKRNAEETNTT